MPTMTADLLANNAQIILGWVLGLITTIFVQMLINHHNYKRLKYEHNFGLNKEMYFKLQNQANEVIVGVQKYREIVDKFTLILKTKVYDFPDGTISKHFD